MDTPVVWGILSVSKHYSLRVHPGIRRLPGIELRAIASRSKEKAEAASKALGIPIAYGSYEVLLADPKVEAVYIPTPNSIHAEWIEKCAAARKHVLCEKPIAMNAAEAERAAEAAKRHGVLLMEAFMYKFHPQWLKAKEIIDSGELGDIRSIQTVFSYDNRDPGNIRNKEELGGGALYDIGCYAVSSARFLLGREPSRALAMTVRDQRFNTDVLSSGILDFGSARLVFTVSTQTFPAQRVEALGSGGRLEMSLPFNAYPDVPLSIDVTTGLGRRTISFPPADQYLLMFESFSRAIRAGGAQPYPPEDAAANMRVLDALFRSERRGGWEDLRIRP